MGKRKTAFIVAVDGPAGSGKSSICSSVCDQLKWVYVNTGAVYRAVGVLMEREKFSLETATEVEIEDFFNRFNNGFRWDYTTKELFFNDENLTPLLGSSTVGNQASKIAKSSILRANLLPLQRKLAQSAPTGALLDGRDIGTVVFPKADLKIYMTANVQQRAMRRLAQLRDKYPSDKLPNLDEMVQEITNRDIQDSERGVAPLVKADDAIEFDTSSMTLEESISNLASLIKTNLKL